MAETDAGIEKIVTLLEVRDERWRAGLDRAEQKIRRFEREARRSLQGVDAAVVRSGQTAQRSGAGWQNLGFQIQDFAVQVGAGTSATQALGQQLPQLLSGFGLLGVGMGVLVSAGLPVVRMLMGTEEAAGDAKDAFDTFSAALGNVETYSDLAGRSMASLREEFGQFADDVKAEAEALLRINIASLIGQAADPAGTIGQQFSEVEAAYRTFVLRMDAIRASAATNGGILTFGDREAQRETQAQFDAVLDAAGMTLAEFQSLQRVLGALATSSDQDLGTLRDNLTQVQTLLTAIIERGGGSPELVVLLNQVNSELNRIRALAVETGEGLDGAAGAAGSLSRVDMAGPVGMAAGEAARLANHLERARDAAVAIAGAATALDGHFGANNPTPGQIAIGNQVSASAAADNGILALIRAVEGTAGPNGYNTSLANGAFLPGGREQNLVNQSLASIRELQRGMLAHPDNTFNSSAIGAYQITGQTLDDLVKWLGLDWNEQFSAGLQDRMAQELMRRRPGISGLRGTWAGFDARGVPDATINRALGVQTIPTTDPEVAREAEQAAKDAADARETEAKATEAAKEAYDRLVGSMDPVLAAQQALAAGNAVIAEAVARETIGVEEAAAAYAKLNAAFGEANVQAALENILAGFGPDQQAQMEAAREAAERLADAAERGAARVADIFSAMADGSMTAKEAIGQLLLEIAKAQMLQGLKGLATPGSPWEAGFALLDSLVGGFRANGGPVQAGVPYLVNENTPNSEIFVPSTSGAVLNVPQAQAALRGTAAPSSGGRIAVESRVYVDQSGNWQAEVARISGKVSGVMIDQNNASLMQAQRRA